MTNTHKLACLLSGVAMLALSGPVAQAQTAPDQASASSDTELDTIIVSARRRDEQLLDVPIAVTAYSGDALLNAGIRDITSISETTPNLTLEVSRGTNSTITAFIRGVGQQDPVAGFEAGVGIYIDDVYLNRPQASVLDVYELERIEVLRGPQGTLYGRNTIGGAVKYVTKRLSNEFEAGIRTNFGTYGQIDAVGSVNIPITSWLRIGGAVATLNRKGYGENINLGIENYDKDVIAGRVSLEADPIDGLFISLTGDIVDDSSNPRNGARLIPGQLTGAPVLPSAYDTRAGLNSPEQHVNAKGASFLVEYQATDAIKLRNILAYRQDNTTTPIDFDSLPSADVDVPTIYRNRQTSEEFQLLYESDSLSGLVGFYYLDANAFNVFDVILANTGALIGLPGLNANTFGDVDTKTWSIFFDATYDFLEQFSLSVGGRFTNDRRDSRILRRTFIGGASPDLGGTGTQIAVTSDFDGSRTFKDFTPRASLAWKPNNDHNIYFSFSQGFKGGGFDPRGQTTATPDFNRDGVRSADEIFEFLSFDPEQVTTYEIGWKASLFDRRLTLALAGFRSNYSDVQIPGSVGFDSNGDGVNDSFVGITSNAGRARLYGVELEGNAKLAHDFAGAGTKADIGWTLGYIDAEYQEFIDAFGNDVADQRTFQNTPKWTASSTLTLATPLKLLSDGDLSLANTVSYRSSTSQFETPNPFLDQPGYILWNASLVWTSQSGGVSIGLHGRNITDKRYIVAGYNFVNINQNGTFTPTLGREGVITAFYGDPRTITGSIGLKF
ncbi:MAG: TonB-dependent receptor [Sphingomonadales bacterium]|nr:MAG: TonB-dependent receptor [Sphingomonadales bacterium]